MIYEILNLYCLPIYQVVLFGVLWTEKPNYKDMIQKQFKNKFLTIKAKYYIIEPYYMEGSTLNTKLVLLSF